MRPWKYHEITCADHEIFNPASLAAFDELVGLLRLPEHARVLDIACGSGGPLIRIAKAWTVEATAVDLCPQFLARAREASLQVNTGSTFRLIELDGANFSDEPESYDLAMCLGASWVFGGHRKTLRALAGFTRPGGLVLAGEPFWMSDPPSEYLEAEGETREGFGTHFTNVRDGVEEGLSLLFTVVSEKRDWDRYEGMRWQGAERYAAANPGDPDVPEILERAHRSRDAYLKWGRDVMGWAIYLFQKPARRAN